MEEKIDYKDYLKDNTESVSEVHMIPINWIMPSASANIRLLEGLYSIDPTNPKDAFLLNTIPTSGLLIPVNAMWAGIDQDGVPQVPLTDGDRRTAALCYLFDKKLLPETINGVQYIKDGVLRIPTIIVGEEGEDFDEAELRRKQYVYNSALQLSPFQIAKHLAERVELGDKIKDLAFVENRTEAYVSMHVNVINKTGFEFHELLKDGTLGFTLAYEIVKSVSKFKGDTTPYEVYTRALEVLEDLTIASFKRWLSQVVEQDEIDDEDIIGGEEDGDGEGESTPEVPDEGIPVVYNVFETLGELKDMSRQKAGETLAFSDGLLADILEAISEGASHEKKSSEIMRQLGILMNVLSESPVS